MTEERALSTALRDLVDQPVVAPGLAGRVEAAWRRRRRRRGAATVAAVACAAGAMVVVPSLSRTTRSAPPASSPTPSAPARTKPLLAANGYVLAVPGRPVRFCPPRAADTWPSQEPPQCPTSVTLVGADLGTVRDRTERDGMVWGFAWIAGTYRDGTMTVVEQGPPRMPTTVRDPYGLPTEVPCPEPPGGWPVHPSIATPKPHPGQPDHEPVRRHSAAHPGEVVGWTLAYPAKDRAVIVVAATRPDRVEAALRPDYGGSLCVVRSRYTAAEVERARSAVRGYFDHRQSPLRGYGDSTGADGQRLFVIEVDVLTPEVERFVAEHPDGLVVPEVWLGPA